jgi:tripartite-type tricarboxylate transporter receptor subunit TctC
MKIHPGRRRAVIGLASAFSLPLSRTSNAQSLLPTNDLRIFVGFIGGGGTDIVARKVASALERRLGRHVHVENRPSVAGAGIGEILKDAPADGSVVAFVPSTTLVAKLATKEAPIDPSSELAPITMAGTFSLGLAVSPKIGVSTFNEYLQWVKQGDPTRRRLGNTASDAYIGLLDLVVGKSLDVVFTPVSYIGAAPMAIDLEQGRVPAAVSAVASLLQHHRGHRLKILMTSGHHRLRMAPEVPTARELGYPALEIREWFAFFAPPAAPAAILSEWNRQLRLALEGRDLNAELAELGVDVETSSPEDLRARVSSHMSDWQRRLRGAGIPQSE